MERILDENERIRRAEEIYLKRNNRHMSLLRKNEQNVKKYFGSKILLYILVLLNIGVIIFCLQNKEYIFTEEFLKECNQYNINISEKMNQLIKNFLVEDGVNNQIENKIDNSIKQNEAYKNEIITNKIQENIIQMKNEKESNESVGLVEESSSLSEMELDIENLKKIYKFVKPIDAVVSSEFGARESEYQNVTGYHTGIDLAAEKGTPIKAAMQGIVELVSGEGDYRKTCKN